MKRLFILAVLAPLVGAFSLQPAMAQKTKAQLTSEVSTTFPDNTVGAITPLAVRTFQNDLINSIMPTAPVVSGNLACFNGTTGLLQDCGVSPSTLPLTVGSTPIASGASGRVLYDNAGFLGEYTATQLTAQIQTATATTSGAVPAWPNNTTTYFRGDGTYASAVSSFNSRVGAVSPAVGDYPVSLGGTGTTNLIQVYEGIQPEKLGSAVIAVNPGTWSNSNGTQLFNSTQVLTANLAVASIDFNTNPCTGGMVSGALSVAGATTDGTDVMLYLIHRISDGKVCLVGSNSNTYSGVQTELNAASGCSPNLCQVDRRVRFAFVWNWATNGGWSGIPDFQAPMGAQGGSVFLTNGGAGSVYRALTTGTAAVATDVNLGSSSAGNPTTVAGRWLSNLNRRVKLIAKCTSGTTAGGGFVLTKSSTSGGVPVCGTSGTAGQVTYGNITLQTDSANDIQYFVTGTSTTLDLWVIEWSFSDPS